MAVQRQGEDAGHVFRVLGLVELEHRLAVRRQAADDLDLAAGMAHGVAHGLADAVLAGFGVVHDDDALRNGHLEAALDARDRAALEDVIGGDADAREAAEELAQHLAAVVHAAQQHRLVAHLHAAHHQLAHGARGLRRQLAGVVELGDDDERLALAVFLEHVQQLAVAVDALGERDGQAGAETYQVEVVDGREAAEIALDDVVGVHQRVAARDEDVVDLAVRGDVGDGLVRHFQQLVVREAHEALAEAVAAVHGADVGGEQQHRGLVLVLQSVHLGVGAFAAGVEGAALAELVHRGDAHAGNGIVRVVSVHEGEIIGRYHHRVTLGDARDLGLFFWRQAYGRGQLGRSADAFGDLILPTHHVWSLPFLKK